jgi:hypothetical protein
MCPQAAKQLDDVNTLQADVAHDAIRVKSFNRSARVGYGIGFAAHDEIAAAFHHAAQTVPDDRMIIVS